MARFFLVYIFFWDPKTVPRRILDALGHFLAPRTDFWPIFVDFSSGFRRLLSILAPFLVYFGPTSLPLATQPPVLILKAGGPSAKRLNPAAPRRVRMGGVESPCKACMLHAACALRMQFMLMHSVHGMKCRAFSMLCWGGTRRIQPKTSFL